MWGSEPPPPRYSLGHVSRTFISLYRFLYCCVQVNSSNGQRHEQAERRTGQLGGPSGEHGVAQVYKNAFAGAAVARTADSRKTENRVRDTQPKGHVRVLLPLLQADPRLARVVRRVLRSVHPRQDADRPHLGSHTGLLGTKGRAERAVHQVRGHEKGERKSG